MSKKIVPVSGMHCKSCEILLEKTVGKLDGVKKATANQAKGTLEIEYEETVPNWKAVESVINENGYSVGEKKKLSWFQNDPAEYETVIVTAFVLAMLYYISKHLGFSFWEIWSLSSPTLSVAFLIGLTAGVSSCIALIGWLVLGISAKWNEGRENAGGWSRFEPHLFFNLWRVLGFGFFWGLLWAFGSFIGFSNGFVWLVTLAAWALMLILGLGLTGLSPRLGEVSVTLPKFFGKNVWSDSDNALGTMTTGALTFFLPCGFTLAMQVYAVSTGSFMAGAMTLALFALGTAPWLLGIGWLTSFFKGQASKTFFKISGVVVLALAIFNVSNGYTLLSLWLPSAPPANVDTSNYETQEVRMVEDNNGYSPSVIKIRPNTKIRLVIDAKAPFSCASQFTIPSVRVRKQLEAGENVIEFVSPASGTVRFSCSMGMYTGKFVVEEGAGRR